MCDRSQRPESSCRGFGRDGSLSLRSRSTIIHEEGQSSSVSLARMSPAGLPARDSASLKLQSSNVKIGIDPRWTKTPQDLARLMISVPQGPMTPSPPTFSTSSSSGRTASGVKPGVEGSTLLLGGFFHFLCQSVGFYPKCFVKDSFHVLGPLLHRFTRLA